ncbi:hypothetical protein PLICRDRAFT_410754 [Plicaturopsis crispa FD-325 SS-3]|nr:hypothetical protein PLICRDRAFT_410754 [Plicaturopsis crispa FD-325 SS-3]
MPLPAVWIVGRFVSGCRSRRCGRRPLNGPPENITRFTRSSARLRCPPFLFSTDAISFHAYPDPRGRKAALFLHHYVALYCPPLYICALAEHLTLQLSDITCYV